MNETLSLARLLWVRNRWPLTGAALTALSGVMLIILLKQILPELDAPIYVGILAFCLMPLALIATFALDFGNPDLSNAQSGFNPWLLRSPIRSFKVISVPLAAKSLLIVMLVSVGFFSSVPLEHYPDFPLTSVLAWMATAIWVSAISWRKFETAWLRILAIIVVLPLSYCLGIAHIVVLYELRWSALWLGPIYLVSMTWLGLSLVFAHRWFVRARYNESSSAQSTVRWVGEKATNVLDSVRQLLSSNILNGANTAASYTDLVTRRHTILALSALPIVVLLAILIDDPIPSILLIAIGIYLVFLTSNGAATDHHHGGDRRLPLLIATSPLTEIQLATWQLMKNLRWSLVAMLGACAILWFDSWLNAAAWQQRRELLWCIAIVSLFLSVSRGLAWIWLYDQDRSKAKFVASFLNALAILVPLIAVLVWFINQESLESTQRTLLEMRSTLPPLIIFALVAKFVIVAIAVRLHLKTFPNTTHRYAWVVRATLAWLCLVATVSIPILGITYSGVQATGLSSFTAEMLSWLTQPILIVSLVALLTPLTRLIILPWAIGRDLHR